MKIIKPALSLFFAFSATSVFALSAETVYNSSAKLFAFDNLNFTVNSIIDNGSSPKKRSFLVAKKSSEDASSLLVRFKEPKDIRCTAILVITENQKTTNYLYFPSLKRVRVVPKKDQNSEIFGLGISYAELNSQNDVFEALEELIIEDQKYYKITKLKSKMKYVYFIKADTSTVQKIETYKNDELKKEIYIEEIMQKDGNSLITKWRINNIQKSKQLFYSIDKSSISSELKLSMFYKNRLGRCSF